MKRIILIVAGILMITQSILVWISYLNGAIEIYDNGPTSIFITAKVSLLGNFLNLLIFLFGISALVWAAFFVKKKEKHSID